MTELFETKASDASTVTVDDAGVITGMAWPFGSPCLKGDIITKGAFNIPADMPMLYEHDRKQLVGIWNEVKETDAGLEAKGQLFVQDSPRARAIRTMIKTGQVTGLSVTFRPIEMQRHSPTRRTFTSVNLNDISLVVNPCHPGARVLSAKSATADILAAEAFRRAVERFSKH